jgi:hypothetical protein
MKLSEAENMDDEDFREWWINEVSGIPKGELIQLFMTDEWQLIEVDA